MKKTFLFIALIAGLLSCNKYTVQSKVQMDILERAYDNAKSIYTQMNTGNRAYPVYESTYNLVALQIDSVYNNDLSRNSNSALLREDKVLIKVWSAIQNYHRGRGQLNAATAEQERKTMESAFTPRLKSEQSIK